MDRRYQLALERIEELEEKYMDLKAEYEFLKYEYKELYEHKNSLLDKNIYLEIRVEELGGL